MQEITIEWEDGSVTTKTFKTNESLIKLAGVGVLDDFIDLMDDLHEKELDRQFESTLTEAQRNAVREMLKDTKPVLVGPPQTEWREDASKK